MQAMVRANKREVARVEQEIFESTVEACEDNNAMFLMAIQEEYGYGKQRLLRVIERFNKISDDYTKLLEDGYTHADIHAKIVERLNDMGFEEKLIYSGRADFYEAEMKSRSMKKNQKNVSFREAADAVAMLNKMKELQNAKGALLSI